MLNCEFYFYRYRNAGVDQPQAIFVDRGCCRDVEAPTQLDRLFHPWTVPVRLDIFHFMQRFRYCCTTESHPLYGEFMRQLSSAIFEWDSDDMTNLISAKKSLPGGSNKSDRQVSNISGNAVQCEIWRLVQGHRESLSDPVKA